MRLSKFEAVKEAILVVMDLFLKIYSVFRKDKVKDDLNNDNNDNKE